MQRPAFGFKRGISDMMYREPRQPVPGLLGGGTPTNWMPSRGNEGAAPPQTGGGGAVYSPIAPAPYAPVAPAPYDGGGRGFEGVNAHGPAFNKTPFDPTQVNPPADMMGRYPQPMPRGGPTNYPGIERPLPPMPPMNPPQMGAPSDMMYRGVTPPSFAGNANSGGRPTLPPMMGAGNSVAASPPPAAFAPNTVTTAPGGVRPGTFYRPNRLPRNPRAPMRGM